MNERLFAIGDIHGCFEKFREMVESKIEIRKSDKLILLGDYIDRGFQSRETVDYIIGLQENGFDITALIGNHEYMLLEALDSEDFVFNWYANGGEVTLSSFGIESIRELPGIYVDFFRSLLFYYSFRQFLFVHAGFNDEIVNPFDDRYYMIWTRNEKYTNPVLLEATIVHGHTPIPLSVCQKNIMDGNSVINIDTGCVYGESGGYGCLSAIELYSGKLLTV